MQDLTPASRIEGASAHRYELAGREPIALAPGWARALLEVEDADADWLEYEDQGAGVYRAAHLVDGRIESCLFVARLPGLPPREWLAALFGQERLLPQDRADLLAGRARAGASATGPTVCSCFGVGRATICKAIREHKLVDVAGVTACVKAGGNCGSCVPEIRQLLADIELAAK